MAQATACLASGTRLRKPWHLPSCAGPLEDHDALVDAHACTQRGMSSNSAGRLDRGHHRSANIGSRISTPDYLKISGTAYATSGDGST